MGRGQQTTDPSDILYGRTAPRGSSEPSVILLTNLGSNEKLRKSGLVVQLKAQLGEQGGPTRLNSFLLQRDILQAFGLDPGAVKVIADPYTNKKILPSGETSRYLLVHTPKEKRGVWMTQLRWDQVRTDTIRHLRIGSQLCTWAEAINLLNDELDFRSL